MRETSFWLETKAERDYLYQPQGGTTMALIRGGLGPAEGHCLNLSGVCRRDVCKVVEDQIGACRRRMKCCRAWWILMPIPTPLIMSDDQEPLKRKLK
nr:beta-defensin 109-like [Pan paniscus]